VALAFRGVPVVSRFDPADRRYRVVWAGLTGMVNGYEDSGRSEAELLEALDGRVSQGMTVIARRTEEGIEVDVRRYLSLPSRSGH
jgi:hypothetical protein